MGLMNEKLDLKKKLGLTAVLSAIGAYIYRLRGGGPGPKLPRPLDQILFSLFPCIFIPGWVAIQWLTDFNWSGDSYLGFVVCLGFLVSAGWAVAWESSGHGGTMDYAHSDKEPGDGRGLEVIEHLIYPWLYNLVPRYWYDAIGHGLTGFIATLLPGIFVAVFNPLAGILLALSGALKSPAYALAWRFSSRATETGEWLSGGLRWAAASIILFFIIL